MLCVLTPHIASHYGEWIAHIFWCTVFTSKHTPKQLAGKQRTPCYVPGSEKKIATKLSFLLPSPCSCHLLRSRDSAQDAEVGIQQKGGRGRIYNGFIEIWTAMEQFNIFFSETICWNKQVLQMYEVSRCLKPNLQNVSPSHLLLGLFFNEKVTWCNERGILYQEMGVVSCWVFFFLEHLINFEGLVILKFIGKVCQTTSLQEILAQDLY